jgi:glycosyltransferase involved in cell wall biosynthesis
LKRELEEHGFDNIRIWSRGVDVERFRPMEGASFPYSHPVFLYVGRVAVEKNVEAFLELDLPGTKVVVGDGPARSMLERKFPDAKFLGQKTGDDLIAAYSASDVFVFPSRTDTFGLVVLESLACGTPVAAYPVQGPSDVVGDAPVAALSDDLAVACRKALTIDRDACRAFALTRSWRTCTRQFLSNLAVEPPVEG